MSTPDPKNNNRLFGQRATGILVNHLERTQDDAGTIVAKFPNGRRMLVHVAFGDSDCIADSKRVLSMVDDTLIERSWAWNKGFTPEQEQIEGEDDSNEEDA